MATNEAENDPVADDIASRNPETDDQVAGEEVLADDPADETPKVAPNPDEFRDESGEPWDTNEERVANEQPTPDEQREETDLDRAERHD